MNAFDVETLHSANWNKKNKIQNSLREQTRGDQQPEQNWSRIRSLAFFMKPEWIRSQELARKPEQNPEFNLCYISLM